MKASELRIGNYHYYTCEDSLDERKKWDEVCQIDSQDLVWLESNPDDEDFKPIPITEEWLLYFGFEYASDPDYYNITFEILDFYFQSNAKLEGFVCIQINEILVIKYVHQLQNLYFTLTGEELLLNEKTNSYDTKRKV